MVMHMPLIPALGRQRQVNLCEFEDSLVYRVNSRTARTLHRENLSQKTKNNKQKNKKRKKTGLTIAWLPSNSLSNQANLKLTEIHPPLSPKPTLHMPAHLASIWHLESWGEISLHKS